VIRHIKFSRLAACGLLLACLVPFVASAQENLSLVVTAGTAEVRLFPNPTSDVVGTLRAGVTVPVFESRPGWYQVRLPKGENERAARYGWIPAELVTLTRTPVADEPSTPVAPPAAPAGVPRPPAGAPRAGPPATGGGTRHGADLFVTIGGGGTKDDEASGGALTFGAGVKTGPLFVTFTAADLILAPGDTFPYVKDTFDNGQTRCRNTLNGQFADDTNCVAVDVSYAFSLDGQIFIPRTPVAVGMGVRFGPHDRNIWFGSAGWYWEAPSRRWNVTVKGQFGDDYVSGLATVAVRVPK